MNTYSSIYVSPKSEVEKARPTKREPIQLSPYQAEQIGQAIAGALAQFVGGVEAKPVVPLEASGQGRPALNLDEFERLYLRIKNRLIDDARIDPILLQLLTQRPELIIDVEPRIVSLDGSSLRGRVARLLGAGWFASARATSTVRKELARTGADPGGGGTLSDVLGAYVRDGFLVREGEGYQAAPNVKVTEREVIAK